MKIACRLAYGGCDYISTPDWTCTNVDRECAYRGRPIQPTSSEVVMMEFVDGLNHIEREALDRYLEASGVTQAGKSYDKPM
jgi:hypothetical protein